MSDATNTPLPSNPKRRTVRLFRNGANQALRIPKEFEFAMNEATLEPVEGGLLLRPVQTLPKPGSPEAIKLMVARLQQMHAEAPLMPDDLDPWANVDEGLLPLDDIVLGDSEPKPGAGA